MYICMYWVEVPGFTVLGGCDGFAWFGSFAKLGVSSLSDIRFGVGVAGRLLGKSFAGPVEPSLRVLLHQWGVN